jgi:histidine triad (HIT) family protein
MSECIFCDILAGRAPANFVYRDELCAAFMDIRPVNPGHVLVVPKVHSALLTELDEPSIRQMMVVAQKVDQALRTSEVICEAVNLFLADGRAAGQDVMHTHLHVIPRYRGDGHQLRFSPVYFSATPASELEKNATLLRKQLEKQA